MSPDSEWLFLSSGVLLSVGLESDRGPWGPGHSRKMAGLWWSYIGGVLHSVASLHFDSCDCCNSVGLTSFGTSLVGRYAGLLAAEVVEDQRYFPPLVAI